MDAPPSPVVHLLASGGVLRLLWVLWMAGSWLKPLPDGLDSIVLPTPSVATYSPALNVRSAKLTVNLGGCGECVCLCARARVCVYLCVCVPCVPCCTSYMGAPIDIPHNKHACADRSMSRCVCPKYAVYGATPWVGACHRA